MPVNAVTYQLDHNGVDQAADDLDSRGSVEQFAVDFSDTPAEARNRKFIALAHPDIPQGLESHPFDPWTYVTARRADPHGGPLTWMVTITYTSIDAPLEQEPEEEWLFAASREPIQRSKLAGVFKGTEFTANPNPVDIPIANSANEAADPEVLKDFDDIVYRHVRNEEVFSTANAVQFKNAINSAIWKEFAVGTVKLKVFSAVKLKAAQLTYWRVTYEFHIRDVGWTEIRPNVGFRTIKLDAPDGNPDLDAEGRLQYETIKDKDGNALTQPVELDEKSQVLPNGFDKIANAWQHNESEDLNTLGIAMTV
jgi:hypothetical protein